MYRGTRHLPKKQKKEICSFLVAERSVLFESFFEKKNEGIRSDYADISNKNHEKTMILAGFLFFLTTTHDQERVGPSGIFEGIDLMEKVFHKK